MKVHIWPDGTWCHAEDLHEMRWMSDDYSTLSLPEEATEDDVDTFAAMTKEFGYLDEQDIMEYFK